ncbi:fungal specific transcription factor domain-containing protein, partial [Fusarium globosum]
MEAPPASIWPAQRQPSRWESVDAHQGPSIPVVERFRTALMHGEGDAVRQNASSLVLDTSLATPVAPADLWPHTYPLSLLYGPQDLPAEDELAALHHEYRDTFGTHVFVSDMGAERIVARSNPSYLQLELAVACIASVFSDSPVKTQDTPYAVSEQLFLAGFHLWLATVEVDGRETRSARTAIAAALFSTYGILAPGTVIKRKTAGLLSNVANIIRRMRMIDDSPPVNTASSTSERRLVGKSALLCYMLLIDIIHGLQSNTVPNYSTSELSFHMPQTGYPFQMIHNALLHGQALPNDLGHCEDALALSLALLSDVIRSHKTFFVPLSAIVRPDTWNPYRPLTWRSELANTVAVFNTALARWESHFLQQADHDVLALHYFTKLYVMVPSIAELPTLARGDTSRSVQLAEQITIPDEALEIAWDVFEHVDSAAKVKNLKMSIWLPEITF